MADRYILRGVEVPVIMPGTIDALRNALEFALRASSEKDGTFKVEAETAGKRKVVRAYQNGEDVTWRFVEAKEDDDG